MFHVKHYMAKAFSFPDIEGSKKDLRTIRQKEVCISRTFVGGTDFFISASNKPSGYACISIWRCRVSAAHAQYRPEMDIHLFPNLQPLPLKFCLFSRQMIVLDVCRLNNIENGENYMAEAFGPFLYTAGILCDVKGRRGRSSNSPCMTLKVYYVILKVKREINQIVWRHKNKKVQALQSQR